MFPALGLLLAWLSTVVYPSFILTFGQHGAGLSMLLALLGVLFIRHDFNQLTAMWQQFPSIFWKETVSPDQTIQKLTLWNQLAKQKGYLALEPQLEKEQDDYINIGLQYIIDEVDELKLTRSLNVVSQTRQENGEYLISLFHFLGRSAVGIGVCFSLFGLYSLIHSDQLALYSLVMVAPVLISLGYGVGLYCLFFYPLASRLKVRLQIRLRHDEMVQDGFVAIIHQENSKVMAHRLQEYFKK
ncbi:hypothetical protein ACFOND_11170 [Reinekea marina]|uniref:Chemotaxis protein MotA n=2 Tax=Reinekea marina TaxID=1310421 RepID=A0ABV7WSD5_9GAMM